MSGDVFTHRLGGIIEQIPRKVKIVDNTLLYDKSIKEAFFHVWDCLTVCAENRVVANSKKIQFCKDTVKFASLPITPTRVTSSDRMLSLNTDFQKPTNLTSAHLWFGLVNQVPWAYAISPVMQPFRDLIKPNQAFYWHDTLDHLFESSKNIIINLVKVSSLSTSV